MSIDLSSVCSDVNIKGEELREILSTYCVDEEYYGHSLLEDMCRFADTKRSAEVAKILIDNGADVNLKFYYDIITYLMVAMDHKNDDMIELLLASGADISAASFLNRKVIHKAYSVKILELLIAYGADIEARDLSGQTILHISSDKGRVDVVRYLVEICGANVNAMDGAGNVPTPSRTDLNYDEIYNILHKARDSSNGQTK